MLQLLEAPQSEHSPGIRSEIISFPGGSDGKVSAGNAGYQVQSLGQEDPLENGMETHSRILAWRIPWTEEPGRLKAMGSQGVRHD